MANSQFGVVRGKRARATRVESCGLPVEGEGSSLVTDGFITASFTKVTKDAEDLEQANADGGICIADRTPPELKWFEFSMEFCRVNPELLSFFTNDPLVLDYAQKPVGFRSAKRVKVDGGAAIEIWTGVGSDDCDVPVDDSALLPGANATSYGYFLAPWIKEATMGDFEIGAQVMTFTISGITGAAPKWGRGPYKVVPTDEQNEPGRLLEPMGMEHLHVQKTTIAPPAITDGAVELSLPMPYFAAVDGGGSGNP